MSTEIPGSGAVVPEAPAAAAPAAAHVEEPKTVPLAVLMQEREARKVEQAAKLAVEAKLKTLEQSQLSESERTKVRLSELEPVAAKVTAYETRLAARRDEALKALGEEASKKLQHLIAKLDPLDALEAIEVFAAQQKQPIPTTPVERGGPTSLAANGAPRTLREWNAMPAAERQKHSKLALTLPE